MASDIWKVGQKSASEVYDNLKDGKDINGNKAPLKGEIWACNRMAQVCDEMRADYENVIKDENNYLEELNALSCDIEKDEQTIEEEIETLQKEIDKLADKIEDGTATEEDKEDWVNKQNERDILLKDGKAGINTKVSDFNSKNEERLKSNKDKASIANDYGKTTVEKGTPLAETKVSHGFFKKLFGKTGKNKKKAGERAVNAGNALLEKVKKSTSIQSNLTAVYVKK